MLRLRNRIVRFHRPITVGRAQCNKYDKFGNRCLKNKGHYATHVAGDDGLMVRWS